MAAIEDMVDVDDAIELVRRMDKVRVLIKTPWQLYIQHTINVHIHGEVYIVHVVEENGSNSDTCYGRKGSAYDSSEELESEDNDAGTPKGVNSSAWMTDEEAEFTTTLPNAMVQSPNSTVSPAGSKSHMQAQEFDDDKTVSAPTVTATTAGAQAPPSGTQNPVEATLSSGQRDNASPKGKAIIHHAKSPTDNGQSSNIGTCPLDIGTTYPACERQGNFHGIGVAGTIGIPIPDSKEDLESERGKPEGEAQHETVGTHFSNLNGSRDHEGDSADVLGLSIRTSHITHPQQILSPSTSKWQVYSRKRSSKRKFTPGLVHGPDLIAELDPEPITPTLSQPTDGAEDKYGSEQLANTVNIEDRPTQFQYEEADFIHSKKQEAADMWELVKSLGVTSGSSQGDFAGKILDMETRDQEEAHRLRCRRVSQ